jgi:peroxiredoxin-like protein
MRGRCEVADLTFDITSEWSGIGIDGSGHLKAGDRSYLFSVPASMGGKGEGTSPEELLTLAVCACFTATLFALLAKARLAVVRLEVAAEGRVADYPGEHAHFAEVRVSPTVYGGEIERLDQYVKLACKAKDRCFIGATLQGNVAYEVGEVTVEGRSGSERAQAKCSGFAPATAG